MAAMRDIALKHCEQCGGGFLRTRLSGRPKKYCSKKCRWNAKDRRRGREERNWQHEPCSVEGCNSQSKVRGLCPKHYQRARSGKSLTRGCLSCGKTDVQGKYCSAECRDVAYKDKRRPGVRSWAEYVEQLKAAAIRQCAECGNDFMPTRGVSKCHGAQKLCSKKCAGAWRARAAQLNKSPKPLFTSHAIILQMKRVALHIQRTTCTVCAGPVPDDRIPKYGTKPRCQPCADRLALEARRRSRRKRKAMERARRKGSCYESVDPFKVFERDGWRCHLCGCKTHKAKRGSIHPKAPELDHIIPLSKGGDHSYTNTACSCRACNHAKGNKIIGQPSLFAA